MKGRAIPLHDVRTPREAVRRIVSVRFAEVLSYAPALVHPKPELLHDLRIACKRLRYTLELFAEWLPECKPAERCLAALQDELGEAHDCDILHESARRSRAVHLAKRVTRDRERRIAQGRRLWARAFEPKGAFKSLATLTGFGRGAQ